MKSCFLHVIAGLVVLAVSNTARAQTGTATFNQGTYTAFSDQSSTIVTVSFTGSPNGSAQVTFATSDETATNGINYTGVTSNLIFAASGTSTNVSITIPILGGVAPQSTQTVGLALSNPIGSIVLGSQSSAVLQIINSNAEAQSTVTFDQSAYTNDDTDPETDINLLRTGDTSGTITVDFNTQDGSAVASVDYTAVSTNVEFDPGVTSIPLAIPLLAPSGCESNKNFTLVLSNPSSGAALGTPSRAAVTILATGATTIQLSATNFIVHEHAGRATVIATRCGDSTAQATVDYATSDGTARSGIDYLGTSGTLIFPAGVSTAGFSFQITGYSSFQSNKTVNVTLSNPSGATLSDPSTATVTIVNDRPQTITFTNSDGRIITLMLKSVGTMLVTQTDPLDLFLDSTEASTTVTMLLKPSKTASGLPRIDQITGNGDCGLIDARSFDVTGAGILLNGYLKQLRIHDLTDGAAITSNGSVTQGTSISAHNIDDGSVISVANRILSVQAARFGNGASLTAEQIGSFSIKGDKKNGLSGDCLGSIEVFGDNLNPNQVACGSLKVAGAINGATISIDNGSLGAVSAEQMTDSTLYVGYTPNDPSNPISGGGTFTAGMRLGSVSIRSSTNGFSNSDIAASRIGDVHLASVVTDNGGLSFGVAAQQISGVSCKAPLFHFAPNGTSDQSLGDFHVLLQ